MEGKEEHEDIGELLQARLREFRSELERRGTEPRNWPRQLGHFGPTLVTKYKFSVRKNVHLGWHVTGPHNTADQWGETLQARSEAISGGKDVCFVRLLGLRTNTFEFQVNHARQQPKLQQTRVCLRNLPGLYARGMDMFKLWHWQTNTSSSVLPRNQCPQQKLQAGLHSLIEVEK